MTTVHVLGTAQDGGVPQPGCFCTNCQRAKQDSTYRRQATSLGVVHSETNQWALIDATPDFKVQYEQMEQLGNPRLHSIWLTHAHIGHYPGLLFLGKEAMNTKRLPVYAGAEMTNFLRHHLPWQILVEEDHITLHQLRNEQSRSFEDVSIIPLTVPHRNEFSETFGFILKGSQRSLLYIPDIDRFEEWEKDIEAVARDVDYCLLDATFYSEDELIELGRDPQSIPHPLMTETMDRLQVLVNQQDTAVFFTHFNHTNRALDENHQARTTIENRGFHLAHEGMTFHL
ncbi:coenzyme PQQ synthesis protein B [Pontibacillus halophilus JSM 076056 = DSM 19796]|uniref:Coenzyme PQQ synthesis protein B n=1 Tax=Pontibacillus halophilus JSM 076056 = DSM 19796 TaxID=1385510 RepID=A0A0A5GPE5_9BACI|nr:MBL fold metallo-hydrolase [Pontibacillus halophilus]KGX93005.1 coenzyme PQQ synthesis protein B [Pontibacillus halophilus JSM 076056 = DSM 19796]